MTFYDLPTEVFAVNPSTSGTSFGEDAEEEGPDIPATLVGYNAAWIPRKPVLGIEIRQPDREPLKRKGEINPEDFEEDE